MNRRRFLRNGLLLTTALAAPRWSAWSQPVNANRDVRVGIIGLGIKGGQHLEVFRGLAGVRVVALCDVDPARLRASVAKLPRDQAQPFATTDARKLIERDDVDAVVIATPDHWHALLGVWAMQAGKDVYVEKPVAHDIWQGQQLVEAAQAYKRIAQAGTQFRSDPGLAEAAHWISEGHIGKPEWGHVVWYELRPAVPAVRPYRPDWLDYDLYCGPAPAALLTREKLHYDWHWWWSTGTGDLGNSGIHAFDICRWFTGATGLPTRVRSMGGRLGVNDAAETPNTQLTIVDYAGLPVYIENRNLPQRAGVKAMDALEGIREGFVLHCSHGRFVGLRGGGAVFDRDGKKLRQFSGDGGAPHAANFIAAVRSRRVADLNAPIEVGTLSTSICLYGNISFRAGVAAKFATCRAAVEGQRGAEVVLTRLEQHLAANGLADAQLRVGPWLEPEIGGGVRRSSDPATLDLARQLVREPVRANYAFPSRI